MAHGPLRHHLSGYPEDSEPEPWHIIIPAVWETEAETHKFKASRDYRASLRPR